MWSNTDFFFFLHLKFAFKKHYFHYNLVFVLFPKFHSVFFDIWIIFYMDYLNIFFQNRVILWFWFLTLLYSSKICGLTTDFFDLRLTFMEQYVHYNLVLCFIPKISFSVFWHMNYFKIFFKNNDILGFDV